MQLYETPRFPIVHADLYRIDDAGRTRRARLGRGGGGRARAGRMARARRRALPPSRLDVALRLDRAATATRIAAPCSPGIGDLAPAARLRAHAPIDSCDAGRLGRGRRSYMQGDASTRAYERLHGADGAQRRS